MASNQMYKYWAISKFPIELKELFKRKCREQDIEMIEQLKKLMRSYVNEDRKILSNQVEIERHHKPFAISSFPKKLLADFKAACAVRETQINDTVICLIKEWING